MDDGWDRLARAIYERRVALGLSRQRLADMAGVSLGSIKNLEKQGRSYERTPPSVAPVTEALGWTRESAKAVLAGGEPTLLNDEDRYRRRESMSDDDLVVVLHHVVYDLVAATVPDTPVSKLKELEDRALRVAREVGLNRPRYRIPPNVEDDPEP